MMTKDGEDPFTIPEMYEIGQGNFDAVAFDFSVMDADIYQRFFRTLPNLIYKKTKSIEFSCASLVRYERALHKSKQRLHIIESSVYSHKPNYCNYLFKILETVLPKTKTLTTLQIGYMNIPGTLMFELFQSLRRPSQTLKILQFYDSPMTASTYKDCLEMISPYQFEEVSFVRCDLNNECRAYIKSFIFQQPKNANQKRKLTTMNLKENHISEKDQEKINNLINKAYERDDWVDDGIWIDEEEISRLKREEEERRRQKEDEKKRLREEEERRKKEEEMRKGELKKKQKEEAKRKDEQRRREEEERQKQQEREEEERKRKEKEEEERIRRQKEEEERKRKEREEEEERKRKEREEEERKRKEKEEEERIRRQKEEEQKAELLKEKRRVDEEKKKIEEEQRKLKEIEDIKEKELERLLQQQAEKIRKKAEEKRAREAEEARRLLDAEINRQENDEKEKAEHEKTMADLDSGDGNEYLLEIVEYSSHYTYVTDTEDPETEDEKQDGNKSPVEVYEDNSEIEKQKSEFSGSDDSLNENGNGKETNTKKYGHFK